MRPLVRLIDVTRRFGDHVAVDRVSLDVADREALALLGPSGCGKTTVLRLIAGLEVPESGSIHVAGREASTPGRLLVPPRHRGVGFVFQDLALWPHMTVADHLRFALEPSALGRHELGERVSETLTLLRIEGLGLRRPHQLSGGEQQRVAIARAVVARPRLLLLDEPFSSLDSTLRQELRHELLMLRGRLGLTMIVVTHDAEDARVLAGRVVSMRAGRVDGTPASESGR